MIKSGQNQEKKTKLWRDGLYSPYRQNESVENSEPKFSQSLFKGRNRFFIEKKIQSVPDNTKKESFNLFLTGFTCSKIYKIMKEKYFKDQTKCLPGKTGYYRNHS